MSKNWRNVLYLVEKPPYLIVDHPFRSEITACSQFIKKAFRN
jgi:hypothetical protein